MTVYGVSGGIASRTANTSRSCHRLYELETFSEMPPSAAFFLPISTLFAAILRLSRSMTSCHPNEMMSGESTVLSTSLRKLRLSGEPMSVSGFEASTFHDTMSTFMLRNVLNAFSRLSISVSERIQ